MSSERPSPVSENSEEGRAFLQTRVALFWKVMFFVSLLSSGMGAVGAIAKPGVDFLIVLALTVQAGTFWWLCSRGQRSIRFSRLMEGGGLFLNLTGGAVLGRYLVAGFAREHSLVTTEGLVIADAYVSMLQMGGVSLMVAIRAALVPSVPRRTILVSAVVGMPMILAAAFVVAAPDGGLAWRAHDSAAYPWLPATAAMMWGFVILTSTVISWVIYGLRRRSAKRAGSASTCSSGRSAKAEWARSTGLATA